MSRPDWKDAPKWASYVAQDPDGGWYWFERKPTNDGGGWFEGSRDGRIASAHPVNSRWQDTLEARP